MMTWIMMVPLLTYCSCSYRSYGLPNGEIQYSYYELVADEGTAPKVVYCEDRGAEKTKTEYAASAEDVAELYDQLRAMGVDSLNGYQADEPMCGGKSYRIYMEFANGEKVNAQWYTHSPKQQAVRAYNAIEKFLRNIARREKK
jgi:hypothetical protein